MFCLAISFLFLAQTAPITLPTTGSVDGPVVRSAETAPAVTPSPSTEGARLTPTTTETTQASATIAPDVGKTITVKGILEKYDLTAKTITIKTSDTQTEETYSVPTSTAITLDDKSGSNWDALIAAGAANLTITANLGNVATSIVAVSPPWWSKLANTSPLVLMIPFLGLFLLMSMRNKRKQEKAQQEKLGSIKRGDRIQTIGGIIGNVVQTDESRVLVKVDESNNTKIWFARSAVGRVLGEEKSSDAKTK